VVLVVVGFVPALKYQAVQEAVAALFTRRLLKRQI
jgi:hypothetical protein